MEARKYLTQKQRVKIMLAQNGYCAICDNKLRPGNIAYDHIQALMHGGDNDPNNWRAICQDPCHRSKTRRDKQDGAKVDRIVVGGKKRKSRPMAGTKASGLRKRFDGTVERR